MGTILSVGPIMTQDQPPAPFVAWHRGRGVEVSGGHRYSSEINASTGQTSMPPLWGQLTALLGIRYPDVRIGPKTRQNRVVFRIS